LDENPQHLTVTSQAYEDGLSHVIISKGLPTTWTGTPQVTGRCQSIEKRRQVRFFCQSTTATLTVSFRLVSDKTRQDTNPVQYEYSQQQQQENIDQDGLVQRTTSNRLFFHGLFSNTFVVVVVVFKNN
jgi:hypothetical protein